MEIDFLIANAVVGRRKNVTPIEVKSGRAYMLKSLMKFRVKYEAYLSAPYVLHAKDLATKDGVTYLPLYMAPLL